MEHTSPLLSALSVPGQEPVCQPQEHNDWCVCVCACTHVPPQVLYHWLMRCQQWYWDYSGCQNVRHPPLHQCKQDWRERLYQSHQDIVRHTPVGVEEAMLSDSISMCAQDRSWLIQTTHENWLYITSTCWVGQVKKAEGSNWPVEMNCWISEADSAVRQRVMSKNTSTGLSLQGNRLHNTTRRLKHLMLTYSTPTSRPHILPFESTEKINRYGFPWMYANKTSNSIKALPLRVSNRNMQSTGNIQHIFNILIGSISTWHGHGIMQGV